MVDTRFHPSTGPLPLRTLLASAGEAISIDDERARFLMISGAQELNLAGPSHIALAAHKDYLDGLRHTSAGAVIVLPALREAVPDSTIAIVSDRPHDVFATLLHELYPGDTRAVVAAGAVAPEIAPLIEENVTIGANVVLGSGVEIGRGTVIGPNTVIGAGVTIGRNCVIASNCSIDCAHLGNNVVLHAGVRIGTEGFGWLDFGRNNRKVPQLGRVIIQDSVEIGANSTVDRGALGDTMIGEGSKLDNLVQIGHNCRIGRHCLIAATSGLSGSTILGDGVLLGGGVGTSGHLSIGAGTTVYGRAAVTKDWPEGSKLAGAPAQDIRDFWKELAILRRLSKGDKH
ncbi:MAG TPA: UDP-3-O-(3-hydroxymyristoyl)glucosamine N-acyltransferase [Arsenicitalea sp.]|jgi:UDP-3-O-[3-hydroxymyristoyl] glucosamine N-acyltransferase|nr:UDP-3-O-(3-hydroxymyristoyl)glucosamine N-acyltransferase [Arsenicitalea sp.]